MIVSAYTPYDQIIAALRRRYGIVTRSLRIADLDPVLRWYVQENCRLFMAEHGIPLTTEELDNKAYEVLRDVNSAPFFLELGEGQTSLWIICEEKIGYLECPSPTLFLEIDRRRGVTCEDVARNTLRYQDFISRRRQRLE